MSRRYDHRLRNAIVTSGDPSLFRTLPIPRSTIRDWMRKGPVEVITSPIFAESDAVLVAEIETIKAKLAEAEAKAELVICSMNILGFKIQFTRVPAALAKTAIIDRLRKAAAILPLSTCLEVIGLSKSRYHSWVNRSRKCHLEDQKTCPRLTPTKILSHEVKRIKQLLLDPLLQHFSIASLALYAKRKEIVAASTTTWYRVKRDLGLNRPGKRIYPAKPRIGIRALQPNQIWHLDQSVIKLVDGTRCFIQAVVDNRSRYVLPWSVSQHYGGKSTRQLLVKAIAHAQDFCFKQIPNVVVDSGCENINSEVNDLINKNLIRRTIAQIEVDFSNSMVESLFYRLKHRHLFRHALTSMEALEKLTAFFIDESNHRIPLAVLGGATPYEIMSGQWSQDSQESLTVKATLARLERIRYNRALACINCLT